MSNPRSGAPKRVAAGLLAGALSVFGLAFAPSAGASATVATERFAGATRYDTAAKIAANTAFAAPKGVIVATGQNYPDALAAATLAGSLRPAPIVLTATATLSPEASAALTALKGKGVTKADIVGGTTAVSQAVEDAIKALGLTVTRHAGAGTAANRYGTAAQIATDANTIAATGSIAGLKAAFFATGLNFADAVSVAPAAYAARIPILLVNADVPTETSAAITALGIKKAYILGGTGAVSDAVSLKLLAATGNAVTRIEGTTATGSSQDRFGTATAIADFTVANIAGFTNPTSAILANGTDAKGGVDALASGPLGGELKAPAILVASLPPTSAAWLDKNSATLTKLYASGGTEVIDDATLAAAVTSAQTVSNDSAAKAVTTRPELTGAAIVATTTSLQATPTSPAGTTVRFTFDEALGSAFGTNAGNFHVYASSAGGTSTADGTTATIETGGLSVLVNFSTLATAASAATLTKATVDFNAVKDAGGAENPEGDAPIGTAGTATPTSGTTSAADLVSVGNFRQALTTGNTAVDFTFDQAAYAASSGGFHLVDVNNVDRPCAGPATATDTTAGGGTSAGGNGTTVITVTCANLPVTTTLYSAANVARGYITAGSVTTTAAGALPSPLEAADVTANSTGPDLLSVAVTAGTTNDTAVYTFDQSILNATGSSFRLYTNTGAILTPSGSGTCTPASSTTDATTCAINASNPTQVLVRFTAASTSAAVGGYVLGDGTASGSAVNGTGGANQPDEEGSAGATSTTTTPGRVAGPDLTAVALAPATDSFGNTSGYSATYTFDVAIAAGAQTAAQFYLYFADGTRWRAGSCTTSTTTTTNVTCTSYTNVSTGASPVTTALGGSVLGTVDNGAVTALTGGLQNTEAAAATTGGTGTPAK